MSHQPEIPAVNDQVMVHALYMYAARLLEDGLTTTEAITSLHEKGLPLDAAQTIIGDLAQAEDRVKRKMSHREVLIGAGLLLAGLAVGLGGFLTADYTGGLVWVGIAGVLALLGGYWLVRGISGSRQPKQTALDATLRRQSHES
ncbi:hypothetical protein ACFLYO_07295 [Chloroflexota bacterium]